MENRPFDVECRQTGLIHDPRIHRSGKRAAHPASKRGVRMIRPLSSSVLIVGSAAIDTIVQGENRARKIGGVVTYAGLTFRKLGLDVTALTNISRRDGSVFLPCMEEGVKFIRGETVLTTRFVNHLEGGHRWQEMVRKARRIDPKRFYPQIRLFSHIHLGPLHPDDFHPDFLTYVRSPSRLVTLDLQGYVRRVRGKRVEAGVSKHLLSALHAADVVKAGVRELETVLDTYRMETEDLVRRFGLDELLVTSGRGGGFLLNSEKGEFPYDARKADEERDPTGAGDVFFAAYLFHRFHQGRSPAESLNAASVIAARQVAGAYIPFESLEIH